MTVSKNTQTKRYYSTFFEAKTNVYVYLTKHGKSVILFLKCKTHYKLQHISADMILKTPLGGF